MDTKRHIEWLYEQLPKLAEQGILSEEQSEKIKVYFDSVETRPAYNWAFITIAVIGALLIGGGIILIFAYNWDDLSRFWRTVLSFLPLLMGLAIYGYVLFRKRQSVAWVEGSSAFLMLMLASSIALVSQTYHILGTTEQFLLTWLLPGVLLLYLMPSTLCAIIYYIGIASWAVETRGSESVWYWALLAAGLPHLLWALRRTSEPVRYRLLGWALVATIPFAWFATIEDSLELYSVLGSAMVVGVWYLFEKFAAPDRHVNPIFQPFRTFAIVSIYIGLMILTYVDNYYPIDWKQLWLGKNYAPWAAIVNFIVWIGVLAGYIFMLVRRATSLPLHGYFAALFPVFLLVLMVLSPQTGDWTPRLASNVYLLAWGIAYLYSGIQYSRMGLVNLGMLIILVLIAFRFFDTEWSYLSKGIAFVLLGSAFLGVNLYLSKKLKRQADS